MRKCKSCKISIDYRHKRSIYCEICAEEKVKNYYLDNKERLKPIRKKWKENNKNKVKEYYHERYLEKDKKRLQDYYTKNKEKIKERNKSITYKEKRKEYRKRHKWKDRYRYSLKSVLNRLKLNKSDYSNSILGYSDIEFKNYIESKFKQGMSWEDTKSFCIDHIVPIVAFKEDTPINIICSLENLQPITEKENRTKNANIDLNHLELFIKYKNYLNDKYTKRLWEYIIQNKLD